MEFKDKNGQELVGPTGNSATGNAAHGGEVLIRGKVKELLRRDPLGRIRVVVENGNGDGCDIDFQIHPSAVEVAP